MSGLSSNESFIKSQESMVQGAIRTPKPINLLKTEFDNIIDKYNATENAKINKKPVILVNEEKYEQDTKENVSRIRREQRKRRSKKTERKLDVEEHERALTELKKFAFIMDSNNTISKKSHSRVNSRSNLKLSEKIWGVEDEDEDDEYELFIGHSSSSENSTKTNSSATINSVNSNVNIVIKKDDSVDDNKEAPSNENNNADSNPSINKTSQESLDISKKDQTKLVIPSNPTPIFKSPIVNLKNDVYFSREDVFKKNINNEEDAQSVDKEEYDDEEKRISDKKKKTRLKQFLKLHKENFLLEMPNALYTDIISESIKILTKTSQNYTSQLGKKDESTIGSIKHLDHLKSMIPSGNQYQQHIDNNSGKFGPGYYQLCAPIDENGQYVQLKEKVLINSLESLNSINSVNK